MTDQLPAVQTKPKIPMALQILEDQTDFKAEGKEFYIYHFRKQALVQGKPVFDKNGKPVMVLTGRTVAALKVGGTLYVAAADQKFSNHVCKKIGVVAALGRAYYRQKIETKVVENSKYGRRDLMEVRSGVFELASLQQGTAPQGTLLDGVPPEIFQERKLIAAQGESCQPQPTTQPENPTSSSQ